LKLNEIVIDTEYLEFVNISGCKLNVAHLNDITDTRIGSGDYL